MLDGSTCVAAAQWWHAVTLAAPAQLSHARADTPALAHSAGSVRVPDTQPAGMRRSQQRPAARCSGGPKCGCSKPAAACRRGRAHARAHTPSPAVAAGSTTAGLAGSATRSSRQLPYAQRSPAGAGAGAAAPPSSCCGWSQPVVFRKGPNEKTGKATQNESAGLLRLTAACRQAHGRVRRQRLRPGGAQLCCSSACHARGGWACDHAAQAVPQPPRRLHQL